MTLMVDDELREVCAEIVEWMDDDTDWAEEASSDMFRSDHFSGGWEGEKDGFTFSYYPDHDDEQWFSLSAQQVRDVAARKLSRVTTREPD